MTMGDNVGLGDTTASDVVPDQKSAVVAEATVAAINPEVEEDGVHIREVWLDLSFTWGGKPFTLKIAESDRVFDLKAQLESLTRVPPERQKILGLVKGKLPPEQERIGNLKLTSGKKFTLVGTPQGDEIKDPSVLEFLPDVVNDLDVDFSANPQAAAAYENDMRNQRKVREATKKLNLNIMNPLRQEKPLLVLDIDYTILDTKPLTSGALPPHECLRPRLHEFLEAVYPYYDICFWSQTSWIWIETKLNEMGMFDPGRNYKIAFVLDKSSMFTVFSSRNGKEWTHQVKPLQIIWNKLPHLNASNTVHIDDLGRNFALNPRQGIKIKAFKDCHLPERMADRELDKLSRYLIHIASGTDRDFTRCKHQNWEVIAQALPPS